MKYKGSISQSYLERDKRIIPDLVRRAKYVVGYPTNLIKIFEVAATLPVKAHYISDDSAIVYVRKRMQGQRHHFVNRYKEQLYESLFTEVRDMQQDGKYASMSLNDTVVIALTRPAPCVGLAPTGIRKIYTQLMTEKRK